MEQIIYTHCIECRQLFTSKNVFTREGAKETQLSGMCECCFDELFEDSEECDD